MLSPQLAMIVATFGSRLFPVAGPTAPTEADSLRASPSSGAVVSLPASGLGVVTLALPAAFGDRDDVEYTISAGADGIVVGQPRGRIASGATSRSIVFAIRANARAQAGLQQMAVVVFRCANRSVAVPIVADIAPVRGAVISVPSSVVAVTGGERISVPFRLTSTGNTRDSVVVEAILPAGWSSSEESVPILVSPGESVDGVLRIVPRSTTTGIATIRLLAMSRGTPLGETAFDVHVSTGSAQEEGAGPSLRTGVAAAFGPWPGSNTVSTIELDGQLSDGMWIRARATPSPRSEEANYALSRAGSGHIPVALRVASPDWSIDAGTLGATVTGLAGANIVGRGASAKVQRSGWSGTAVALSPDAGGLPSAGSLVGARVEVTPGSFNLQGAASRLRETRGTVERSLDAVSLGGALPQVLGGRLGGELAHRRYNGAAAAGWSATYTRHTTMESFDVRYLHAPGGSSAFARATSELAMSARRRVARNIDVYGAAWQSTDDATTLGSRLEVNGWSAGAQLDLGEGLQFRVTTRDGGFGASTLLGEFSSGERALETSFDLRRPGLIAQVTGSLARVERRTAADGPDPVSVVRAARRSGVRGEVSLGAGTAGVAVTGQFDRTGAGVGAAPVQWAYGVRVDGRPGGMPGLRIEAAAERAGGAGGASRSLTLRAGAEIIAGPAMVRLSAERNPWVLVAADAGAWMYVVAVSRSFSIPRLTSGTRWTRGLVYRDLNANGRRDRGEPPFAGVLVRRNADVAATNRDGVFLLPGHPGDPYEVDARSLPLGWVVPSTSVPGGQRAIGAIALTTVEVDLSADSADAARVPLADFAAVAVSLRDSTGRTWPSRRVSEARVAFDGVPPGVYSVVADVPRSRETLQASTERLTVVIVSGQSHAKLRLVLRSRPLRFSPALPRPRS